MYSHAGDASTIVELYNCGRIWYDICYVASPSAPQYRLYWPLIIVATFSFLSIPILAHNHLHACILHHMHVSSTTDAPFCRHRHLTTAVELTSDCIAGSFARFPLAGYLFLESQLLEYRTGVLCKEDTRKTSSSALLFEEGPINDYREDMLLCNLWCEALRRLCTLHHSKKDVSSQMSQLCTMCLENLDRIVDRYSLKRASSILPPLFSKEGSFLTLSLYTNLNILHFLRESSNVADNKEPPRQWSMVDLCKDSLAQYCCLPHTSTCFTS